MRLMDLFISSRRRAGLAGAAAGALVFVLLFMIGCGGSQQGTGTSETVLADTGGKLQLTERDYDFGKVPVGKMVEHQFMLKNTGSGPLTFGKMTAKRLDGCWDVQTAVGSTTINPGETTNLTVKMHMGKGMGGPHLFEITVNSSDPAPPANKVTVRADFIE